MKFKKKIFEFCWGFGKKNLKKGFFNLIFRRGGELFYGGFRDFWKGFICGMKKTKKKNFSFLPPQKVQKKKEKGETPKFLKKILLTGDGGGGGGLKFPKKRFIFQ